MMCEAYLWKSAPISELQTCSFSVQNPLSPVLLHISQGVCPFVCPLFKEILPDHLFPFSFMELTMFITMQLFFWSFIHCPQVEPGTTSFCSPLNPPPHPAPCWAEQNPLFIGWMRKWKLDMQTGHKFPKPENSKKSKSSNTKREKKRVSDILLISYHESH